MKQVIDAAKRLASANRHVEAVLVLVYEFLATLGLIAVIVLAAVGMSMLTGCSREEQVPGIRPPLGSSPPAPVYLNPSGQDLGCIGVLCPVSEPTPTPTPDTDDCHRPDDVPPEHSHGHPKGC